MPLARHAHARGQRQFLALQQDVPVHPAEHHLAPVVHLGFLQQGEGPDAGQRIAAGQGLDVVVEVDQQTLAEARLDEAVGVTVERGQHLQAVDVAQEVLGEAVHGEVGHRAALGGGQRRCVAEDEDVRVLLGQTGVVVDRDVVQLVAQAGAGDQLVASC